MPSKCHYCGYHLDDEVIICPECHTHSVSGKRSQRIWKKLGVAVLFLLFALILLYFASDDMKIYLKSLMAYLHNAAKNIFAHFRG